MQPRIPLHIVVGDFNGDGKLDLAVGTGTGTSGSVSVLLGNGDGTFQAPVNYPTGPIIDTGLPGAMAVGDVNGDGMPDLVLAFGGGVLVLLGNGDGTFQTTPISYLAGIRAELCRDRRFQRRRPPRCGGGKP